MNVNGLTSKELVIFNDFLKKASNSQIEQLVTLTVNEYKNRMIGVPVNYVSNEEVFL